MICAIYARVSKERCNSCGHRIDQHQKKKRCKAAECACRAYMGQDPENQLAELRRYAAACGWETREFIDFETGKHSDRAQMQALFEAASRREFGVVLVWALDRFTREGVAETFLHIRKLLDSGIQFESFTEAHFRTTGPAGELMIAIAAWIAKQERLRISERTRAGLARVRAAGRQLGRPMRVFDRQRALQLRSEGKSWRAIEALLKIPHATIRLALERVQQTPSGKVAPRKPNKPVT